MENVYLYLVKRNRQDIKIIGIMYNNSYIKPTRLDDLNLLGLSSSDFQALQNIVNAHKFDWDIWLESAKDFKSLKDNLQNRGIATPASANIPFINLESHAIPKTTLLKLNKNKIMTRRA